MKYGCFPFAFLLSILFVSGCGNKLPDEAKSLLVLTAQSAQERSAAFQAIKGQVLSKKLDDNDAVARWVKAHGEGLADQAAALKELVAAVTAGSDLSEAARRQLKNATETALARAESFKAVIPFLAGTPEFEKWVIAHEAALVSQAEALGKFVSLLNKEKQ